jgi:hypothetical protein
MIYIRNLIWNLSNYSTVRRHVNTVLFQVFHTTFISLSSHIVSKTVARSQDSIFSSSNPVSWWICCQIGSRSEWSSFLCSCNFSRCSLRASTMFFISYSSWSVPVVNCHPYSYSKVADNWRVRHQTHTAHWQHMYRCTRTYSKRNKSITLFTAAHARDIKPLEHLTATTTAKEYMSHSIHRPTATDMAHDAGANSVPDHQHEDLPASPWRSTAAALTVVGTCSCSSANGPSYFWDQAFELLARVRFLSMKRSPWQLQVRRVLLQPRSNPIASQIWSPALILSGPPANPGHLKLPGADRCDVLLRASQNQAFKKKTYLRYNYSGAAQHLLEMCVQVYLQTIY